MKRRSKNSRHDSQLLLLATLSHFLISVIASLAFSPFSSHELPPLFVVSSNDLFSLQSFSPIFLSIPMGQIFILWYFFCEKFGSILIFSSHFVVHFSLIHPSTRLTHSISNNGEQFQEWKLFTSRKRRNVEMKKNGRDEICRAQQQNQKKIHKSKKRWGKNEPKFLCYLLFSTLHTPHSIIYICKIESCLLTFFYGFIISEFNAHISKLSCFNLEYEQNFHIWQQKNVAEETIKFEGIVAERLNHKNEKEFMLLNIFFLLHSYIKTINKIRFNLPTVRIFFRDIVLISLWHQNFFRCICERSIVNNTDNLLESHVDEAFEKFIDTSSAKCFSYAHRKTF